MKPFTTFTILILGAVIWRQHLVAPRVIVILPRDGDGIHTLPVVEGDPFAVQVLAGLGNYQPSKATLTFIEAWKRGEGTEAAFNPLATTQPAEGATCFNHNAAGQCLVRNYTSFEQGVQATVETISNGFYPHILHGLQTNDVEEALNDEELGTWGTGSGSVKRHLEDLSHTITRQFTSNAIESDSGSAIGINVQAALDANQGALRHSIVHPGETWSFNYTVGDPSALSLATIVHPGDGWCNLAARYAQAGRAAGLTAHFQDHGVGDLGGGAENSVAIWNIGGIPGTIDGRQDLELTNSTPYAVQLDAQEHDGSVVIIATTEEVP